MKAQELRIGNYYIFADYEGIVCRKVIEIKHNEFGLIGDYDGVNFEICQPIPLTEEWLLNFGFVKLKREYDQSDNDMYIKNDLCIVWYNSENENFMQFFVNNTGINIKHVHQLQNLYYCLCGEELKIAER